MFSGATPSSNPLTQTVTNALDTAKVDAAAILAKAKADAAAAAQTAAQNAVSAASPGAVIVTPTIIWVVLVIIVFLLFRKGK